MAKSAILQAARTLLRECGAEAETVAAEEAEALLAAGKASAASSG